MALAGLWIEFHRGLVAALVMKNRGQHKNMKNHGAMVIDCWRCNDFKLVSWVSIFQNISVWRLTVWNLQGSRTWNKNNPICWSELKLQNPLSFTYKAVIMLHDHRSAHMSWNHLPPQYSDLKLQKSETAKEFSKHGITPCQRNYFRNQEPSPQGGKKSWPMWSPNAFWPRFVDWHGGYGSDILWIAIINAGVCYFLNIITSPRTGSYHKANTGEYLTRTRNDCRDLNHRSDDSYAVRSIPQVSRTVWMFGWNKSATWHKFVFNGASSQHHNSFFCFAPETLAIELLARTRDLSSVHYCRKMFKTSWLLFWPILNQ